MLDRSSDCIWGCGRSNFNVEHVVGKGFASRLRLPYPLVIKLGGYGRFQRDLEVVVKDRVCLGCNGRWMKKLDDRMREVMGSCITDGTPVTIAAHGTQLQIARWAFKVATLLMLWIHDECVVEPALIGEAERLNGGRRTDPYVPVDDFAYMGRQQRPPDHVLIWLGIANNDLPPFFVSASALSRPADPAPERVGYYVAFALRKLVVYVLAGSPRDGDVLRQALGLSEPANFAADALVSIWPTPEGAMHWPPLRPLQTADIEKLTASRITWGEDYPPA